MSSVHEGLSIALVEALASGLPCVVTNVGGLPEVVREPVEGSVVAARDPHALAGPILRLFECPALRASMGAAGTCHAKHFNLKQAGQKIEEIYTRMLA